ncbi:TetR/AcrR family transcriptional regulator [Actinocatenispora sera]|uniref:HTH tetR-type domain-containing protein n=1 Tax=Actinocatenispora sera TaxID=390989 RepID=A0A810L2H2_9ACTN|nr:TetR/AcrR family transcriptional regulator [Actinocatenispora sera]BCJ28636.1 hypothetical protein Asera_27440 [Actinocatenispora sera]
MGEAVVNTNLPEVGAFDAATSSRAVRAHIVAVAAGLMFDRGVARVGLDRVRRAAGASEAEMVEHFPTKRALVRAVIAWQSDRVIEFNTQAGTVALDSFEALRAWADRHVDMQRALDFVIGFRLGGLAGQLGVCDTETRAELASGFDRWWSVVRSGLAAMQSRGVLVPDAPVESLATALIAAHQGGALLAQVKRDVAPLHHALHGVLDFIESFAAEPMAP